MPSDSSRRSPVRGFSLLETLISTACLGVVLVGVYSISTRLSRSLVDAKSEYELTMMVRALLNEYTITYPAMPTYGIYKDRWEWEIREVTEQGLKPTKHDHYFKFVKIILTISQVNSKRDAKEYSIVVARRG